MPPRRNRSPTRDPTALLLEELEYERELARRREARPLDHYSWLPLQLAYFLETAKRKDARSGNQGQGKTTCGAADCIWRAEGRHPFRWVPPPPTFQWILSPTERASGIAQRKLWELVDRSQLAADSPTYDPRKGAFSGKYPKLLFKNGSWIEFRWGGGDVMNLASEKLHHVWIDEPPENERVFNECQKRVLRTNGDLSLTLTPVNRPVDWLQAKVKNRKIIDLHFDMRPEHLVFAHGPMKGRRITLEDGTPCDQVWIDRLIAETSDMEVPVVVHGGWEFRSEGAYFAKVWDPSRMVTEALPTSEVEAVLGIDFGDRPGKQVILLILVDERGGQGNPGIYVLDEYVAQREGATVEDDARGALAMLHRHGWAWSELKYVLSDRDHKAGRHDKKGAGELQAAVAAQLGLEFRQVNPPVHVAKRGEGRGGGSVSTRSGWLHQQMARGNVAVHPRCKLLIDALPKYRPDQDNQYKDRVDALVYGLDRYTYRGFRRVGSGARLAC